MSSSKTAHDLELDLNKIYKQINKQYKSITRELVDTIIRRYDDFADIYINESPLNNKEKDVLTNALLTKRILNGVYNEVASIETILNFILNMFIFVNVYESNEPEKLFNGYALGEWMIKHIHNASLPDVKNNPNMNDENIINVFNRFIKITDDDMYKLYKKSNKFYLMIFHQIQYHYF